MKKYLFLFAGSFSLALGIAGILIPVLPTTPFLLLSSYCYLRSSKRLYHWLTNHHVFGTYLYNYLTHRAVKKSARIGVLIFLWLTLSISILILPNPYLKILLITVGIGVSIHLFSLKTM